MRPTLVTAALPYANGPVHIGHLAGAYLPSDIYVRFLRMLGEDVLFICGSDEHGVPITLRARKEGITPQQVVDKYHSIIKKSFSDFGISFDIYHRTSEKIHYETAADFFTVLNNKKIFIEEETEQYFDEEAGIFLADRYITGTCPNCGNTNAYGDQCEKCGKSLSPSDLINPHSQLSGKPPVKKKTKHWYLPLDRFQEEWLEKWIISHKDDWKNNVYGQCKSWLDQGLQPRAVTRDLDWGVPVPLDEAKGKVLYVWFDAPIGYISATKALFAQRGQKDGWKKYWTGDARLIHFIGKDNIVFHCLIFPAMLKAYGEFVLPENVPANEFLNLEGDKISTSRNWAVWLHEYLEEFPGKQDVLRYVLCSSAPENKDNDFTWKDFQARNNNELVATLGNFVNRVVVLIDKYFNREINIDENIILEVDEITVTPHNYLSRYKDSMDSFSFREALNIVMELSRMGNKYLTEKEPWKKFDTKNLNSEVNQEIKNVLANCIELISKTAVLLFPFLPETSKKIFEALNIPLEKLRFIILKGSFNGIETISIEYPILMNYRNFKLSVSNLLLFEKIEDEIIERQIKKLMDSKEANAATTAAVPAKPVTTFDDFQKMDIRVGTIIAAERVPKTDKLLKLTIDTGVDQRIVVSGIAKDYEPEKIIGQQVSLLLNLEPRKIKGIESQGMILMAENLKGELAFVAPTKAMENGGTIK